MSENEKIEDITKEVIDSGLVGADGTLVSADDALATTSVEIKQDAKDAHKKALYKNAQARKDRVREEAGVGEIQSKLIGVNRITKVVKGGRTLRFNAVVVIGDKNGKIAVGNGKAREVTEAIKKAEQDGKKNFVHAPIVGNTIPHEVTGKFGTSQVKMLPTKEGNGIIAGGPVRAVLELAGYRDVTAKCYGSTNSTNVVKATVDGISRLRTKEEIAKMLGK